MIVACFGRWGAPGDFQLNRDMHVDPKADGLIFGLTRPPNERPSKVRGVFERPSKVRGVFERPSKVRGIFERPSKVLISFRPPCQGFNERPSKFFGGSKCSRLL